MLDGILMQLCYWPGKGTEQCQNTHSPRVTSICCCWSMIFFQIATNHYDRPLIIITILDFSPYFSSELTTKHVPLQLSIFVDFLYLPQPLCPYSYFCVCESMLSVRACGLWLWFLFQVLLSWSMHKLANTSSCKVHHAGHIVSYCYWNKMQ